MRSEVEREGSTSGASEQRRARPARRCLRLPIPPCGTASAALTLFGATSSLQHGDGHGGAACGGPLGLGALRDVSMERCSLGDVAVIALATALRWAAPHVVRLGLRENAIGDAGALVLASLVQELCTLRVLDVRSNPMTDVGVTACLDGILDGPGYRALSALERHVDPLKRTYVENLFERFNFTRTATTLGLFESSTWREFCECFPNCTDDGLYWQALLADADATTFESTELEGDSEGEPAA